MSDHASSAGLERLRQLFPEQSAPPDQSKSGCKPLSSDHDERHEIAIRLRHSLAAPWRIEQRGEKEFLILEIEIPQS